MRQAPLLALAALSCALVSVAQTPAAPATATLPLPPRQIPPAGFTLVDSDRQELTAGVAKLRVEIDATAAALAGETKLLALLPDVDIFHKAVDWALRYDEFMAPKEVAFARELLKEGQARAEALRAKTAPWLDATGLIVRGYRSKLDGSIQPYGLVVPESLKGAAHEFPLMVWLLGRGEKRTELAFLAERKAGPPQLTPKDTLTLVPYGRFCNATKFAGEVDVFEALAAVRAQYRIDPLRIAVAGFSMGGGSTWHLATHYSGLWCAASPGAGFAETPIFTKASAPNKEQRPAWEQLLWRQYEGTGIAGNLFNLPTLAYAGELDGQKEASDLMEAAMAREGLKLERFIGPQTAHKYHDETKATLTRRFEELIAQGRAPAPREVRLQTYTLRYPEVAWVRLEQLEKHWELADVRARIEEKGTLRVDTKNVAALTLTPPTAGEPLRTLVIDNASLPLPSNSGAISVVKAGSGWTLASARAASPAISTLRKSPGLTGPIDDAFMEPFLFVRPSGKPLNPELGAWVENELTAARHLWRDVFRGEAPVKADRAVTDADIASRNLVLWGDPSSNAVLARLLPQLPLKWDGTSLTFAGRTYPSAHHAPILIFPNPLNPKRYVVLNSGIDFRADGYGNNALQTPKLPDWAIVDLKTAPGPRWPGKIVSAGFFNEEWQ